MIRPQVAALLCLHIAVWTLAACIGASSANLHHDMTEAYDWGREFQLGYAKHPPVFAWVAGAWFLVMPQGWPGLLSGIVGVLIAMVIAVLVFAAGVALLKLVGWIE